MTLSLWGCKGSNYLTRYLNTVFVKFVFHESSSRCFFQKNMLISTMGYGAKCILLFGGMSPRIF